MQDTDVCVLCDQSPDTLDHLLLGCVFSRELWSAMLRKLHLDHAISVSHDNIFVWWLRERKSVPKIARSGFDYLFFWISWSIWKERNARTFRGPSTQPTNLLSRIVEEAREWSLAGYRKLSMLLLLL